MTRRTWSNLVARVERASERGTGLRLDPEAADMIRCLFELGECAECWVPV